ncbi:phage tail sheath family protein [Thermocoleostomius sinensis]|uniref:Phage tail sheath subtilisin-like domain-containing protein n=1 Tax=Thermocoleostomius sinensis A174 TaxID=2016057 RepID=A0A9E8ZDZ6_9CYAN|nr:phage tail sheath C-terminal domain-containing protein [Thermocoleostomius sinensis]WAL60087.1 phage tail sheath subtilisin-like domain-containing protein [Thermocoleostomius sinensis A174]
MARLDYFAPGVYVEEIDRGSRPIEGTSLSVAGFVGFTEDIRGGAQLFEPMLVANWNQYLEYFAKPGSKGFTSFDAYLPFAVRGWFDNGGGRCWVVSIGTQAPLENVLSRTVSSAEPVASESIPLPQASESFSPETTSPTETGATESELPSQPREETSPESETSESTSSANFQENTANLSRVAEPTPLILCTVGKKETLKIKLKPQAPTSNPRRIQVVVEPDEPRPQEPGAPDVFNTDEFFKITLKQGERILEGPHRHLSMDKGVSERKSHRNSNILQQNAGTYVETAFEDSAWVTVEVENTPGHALSRRPADGTYEVSDPVVYPVDQLFSEMYGDRTNRSGIGGLFEIDEVAMVACPDLMLALQKKWLSLEQVHDLMERIITGCENSAPSPKYRMSVLDVPPITYGRENNPQVLQPNQQKPQHVKQWLDKFGRRSDVAAVYYPWVKTINPRNSEPILVPPCGHMMGIWCHTDETRGIYKAPANVQPRGIIDLAYDVNFREQEFLNPLGVNCIRKFPDRGIRVWGARTLAERDDVQWRYISVRRLMSYIEKSIELGTQWAVFEPNDEDLWARVTRTVTNFLERIWREGALFGSTPAEAFFVKCDAELNTPETMMLGRLIVEVGVAPVRPAEFVIFRISQWSPNEK